jgi:hypothetical protein
MIAPWSNWCIQVRSCQLSAVSFQQSLRETRPATPVVTWFILRQRGRPNAVKKRVLRFITVALTMAGAAFAQAPPTQSDVVAQYVNAEMARQHIPGVN